MKLSKVLLVMVLLSFLVIPLSSYALKGPTADTPEAQQTAEAEVKKAGEGEKLASNQTAVTSAEELLKTVVDFASDSRRAFVIVSQDFNPDLVSNELALSLAMNGVTVEGMSEEGFSRELNNPELQSKIQEAGSIIVLSNNTQKLVEASRGTPLEGFLDFEKTLTVSIGKTRLASGETIAQTFPAIFTEAMTGVLTLPAAQFVDVSNADANVERLAKFVASGADGQYVVVMGSTQDQLNIVVARLEKAGLSIKDYENKIIFFATAGDKVITNVEALFMDKQGDFSLCKADNLSPETRKAIQGAV